jgi:cyanophycinase
LFDICILICAVSVNFQQIKIWSSASGSLLSGGALGYIVLEGGAEFGGRMDAADRRALELAGGPHVPVSIIPAAAAPDNNHHRAGRNGQRWFQSLGAAKVSVLPLIDRESADDPRVVKALKESGLIYLLGGFPRHLAQTLAGSSSWSAIKAAHGQGAVIAGSSAGAMVLCEHYYSPSAMKVFSGLGLLPGVCVLPHHDTFGHRWSAGLLKMIPDSRLIGIDEETGLIDDGTRNNWQVHGKGSVTVYYGTRIERYPPGECLRIN